MARMPQVSARELVRFLKSQGFVEDRQSGSHLTLRQPSRQVTVTVPLHTGADVGRGRAHPQGPRVHGRRLLSAAMSDAGRLTPPAPATTPSRSCPPTGEL